MFFAKLYKINDREHGAGKKVWGKDKKTSILHHGGRLRTV